MLVIVAHFREDGQRVSSPSCGECEMWLLEYGLTCYHSYLTARRRQLLCKIEPARSLLYTVDLSQFIDDQPTKPVCMVHMRLVADVLPPARGKCSAADFPSPAPGECPRESSGGTGRGGVRAHHAASRRSASSGPN